MGPPAGPGYPRDLGGRDGHAGGTFDTHGTARRMPALGGDGRPSMTMLTA